MINRTASEQCFCVRMLWPAKDFTHGILFNDLSFIHHYSFVSYFSYYSEVMCNKEHTHILFLL
jgi:hypothetical protein